VGTCLRCGGKYYTSLVGNLILFSVLNEFENWLRFDKLIAISLVAYFFWNTVCMYFSYISIPQTLVKHFQKLVIKTSMQLYTCAVMFSDAILTEARNVNATQIFDNAYSLRTEINQQVYILTSYSVKIPALFGLCRNICAMCSYNL